MNAISAVHPEREFNWLTTELVTFKTPDGTYTKGIIYKPEDFDPLKKYPLIFHYYEQRADKLNMYQRIYGNDAMDFSIAWFVSHGYIVFTPDIHYKIGQNGQCALNSLMGSVNYLRRFEWADLKHMGLEGESFGGYETNYIVSQTRVFAAAVSSSGMSNLTSDYGSLWGSGISKEEYYENRQGRMAVPLWANPGLYIRNSPIFFVNRVNTPMLTVANENDRNVSFAQGLAWFLALRRLGKPIWMLQYDGKTHGLAGRSFVDFTLRSQQFFDYYLKGCRAPMWMVQGIPARLKGVDMGLRLNDKEGGPGPGLLNRK
jgi:dipeptidyl aminopeptidase/acylaminoacyl peptidase